jgi:hypothetical protein
VECGRAGDTPGRRSLQVATWLQSCHDAGIAVRVQINESATPEAGTVDVTAPADQTGTWCRQLDAALQAEDHRAD